MCYRPAKHEHPDGRWGPQLGVRSSASGSWGIRAMLQTGEEARAKTQSGSFDELTPKGVWKGSMSSGSTAPPQHQPGLTHTGQSEHLFESLELHTACTLASYLLFISSFLVLQIHLFRTINC